MFYDYRYPLMDRRGQFERCPLSQIYYVETSETVPPYLQQTVAIAMSRLTAVQMTPYACFRYFSLSQLFLSIM